jgi:hypothetical protein
MLVLSGRNKDFATVDTVTNKQELIAVSAKKCTSLGGVIPSAARDLFLAKS